MCVVDEIYYGADLVRIRECHLDLVVELYALRESASTRDNMYYSPNNK